MCDDVKESRSRCVATQVSRSQGAKALVRDAFKAANTAKAANIAKAAKQGWGVCLAMLAALAALPPAPCPESHRRNIMTG